MKEGDVNRNKAKDDPWAAPQGAHQQEKTEDMKLWGVFIFGLIGATATTFAVSQLRRTVDLFCNTELIKALKGGIGSSFKSAFQEGARTRYNQRLREEYEDEMERVLQRKVLYGWRH